MLFASYNLGQITSPLLSPSFLKCKIFIIVTAFAGLRIKLGCKTLSHAPCKVSERQSSQNKSEHDAVKGVANRQRKKLKGSYSVERRKVCMQPEESQLHCNQAVILVRPVGEGPWKKTERV